MCFRDDSLTHSRMQFTPYLSANYKEIDSDLKIRYYFAYQPKRHVVDHIEPALCTLHQNISVLRDFPGISVAFFFSRGSRIEPITTISKSKTKHMMSMNTFKSDRVSFYIQNLKIQRITWKARLRWKASRPEVEGFNVILKFWVSWFFEQKIWIF